MENKPDTQNVFIERYARSVSVRLLSQNAIIPAAVFARIEFRGHLDTMSDGRSPHSRYQPGSDQMPRNAQVQPHPYFLQLDACNMYKPGYRPVVQKYCHPKPNHHRQTLAYIPSLTFDPEYTQYKSFPFAPIKFLLARKSFTSSNGNVSPVPHTCLTTGCCLVRWRRAVVGFIVFDTQCCFPSPPAHTTRDGIFQAHTAQPTGLPKLTRIWGFHIDRFLLESNTNKRFFQEKL